MTDLFPFSQHPDRTSAPLYRGYRRGSGTLPYHCTYDDALLRQFKETLHLFMSVEQLRQCLQEQERQKQNTAIETLYLWDSLYELYAAEPHTQALIGLDTDLPAHADALSYLIDQAKRRQTDRQTPPLQLRFVLDTLHASLSSRTQSVPYELSSAVHWRLCDALSAAVLRALSPSDSMQLEIAGSSLRLLCFQTPPTELSRRVYCGDRLCLVHAPSSCPTEGDYAAAKALFSGLISDHRIRRILPVPAHHLIPVSASCVPGMTIDPTAFCPTPDAPPPYPCDLVTQDLSGWLVVLSSDAIDELERQCADCALQCTTFATVTQEGVLDFAVLYGEARVRTRLSMLQRCRFSTAIHLVDHAAAGASEMPAAPIDTPLLLRHSADAANGCLIDQNGCGDWLLRTVTLTLDDGYQAASISNAITRLNDALTRDGAPFLDHAMLLCGFTVTPQLSRTVLWQYVLQLTHVLQQTTLPCLPMSLKHESIGASLLTLTLVCHKPTITHDAAAASDTDAASDDLPLPAECSLVHRATPRVLIAYTSDTEGPYPIADLLSREGAAVRTLLILPAEKSATALADAILSSDLLILDGTSDRWQPLLSHRRVRYAIDDLVSRDGLCLCQGDLLPALCRAGYAGDALKDAPLVAVSDACAESFTRPLSYIRDVYLPTASPRLHELPAWLPARESNVPLGDPVMGLFRDAKQDEQTVLAVTDSADGTDAIVRLLAMQGHLLAYADGFTPSQLHVALRYFQS